MIHKYVKKLYSYQVAKILLLFFKLYFRKIDRHLTQKNLKRKMLIILMELIQMKKLNHCQILILVLALNILIGWRIVVPILNHLNVLNIEDVVLKDLLLHLHLHHLRHLHMMDLKRCLLEKY